MRLEEPSRTALRVALARAIETLSPEKRRIFADPYAKYFLDGPAKRIYSSWLRRKLYHLRSDYFMPGGIGSVMVRTQFVDEYLRAFMADGIEQLVILGAGYDTRALRIDALKPSSLTLITILGLQISHLIGTAVIIEIIYAMPGIGRLLVNAIYSRDFLLVQGCVMFITFSCVVNNALVDFLYTVLDPRIRREVRNG